MNETRPPTDAISRIFWILLLVAALGAVAYGVYLIAARQSRQLGPFFVGLGLIFVPITVVSAVGALVVIGTGIYCLTIGVNLYGIMFVLLGLVTLADRAKEIAGRHGGGTNTPA